MTIRLVLADDHPLMLDALARLVGQEPDMEVAARCTDGEMALRAARISARVGADSGKVMN